MSTTLERIPGYEMDPPSQATAVQALGEIMGAEKASQSWSVACAAAGFEPPVDKLDELQLVADRLIEQRGLAAVAGRSLSIRVLSYAVLAKGA